MKQKIKIMCGTCENSCPKGCSFMKIIAKILVIIGGLNWGLVGVGMILGKSWNPVNMLLDSMPTVEAAVYVLVGIAAILMIFRCKCKMCCTAAAPSTPNPTV